MSPRVTGVFLKAFGQQWRIFINKQDLVIGDSNRAFIDYDHVDGWWMRRSSVVLLLLCGADAADGGVTTAPDWELVITASVIQIQECLRWKQHLTGRVSQSKNNISACCRGERCLATKSTADADSGTFLMFSVDFCTFFLDGPLTLTKKRLKLLHFPRCLLNKGGPFPPLHLVSQATCTHPPLQVGMSLKSLSPWVTQDKTKLILLIAAGCVFFLLTKSLTIRKLTNLTILNSRYEEDSGLARATSCFCFASSSIQESVHSGIIIIGLLYNGWNADENTCAQNEASAELTSKPNVHLSARQSPYSWTHTFFWHQTQTALRCECWVWVFFSLPSSSSFSKLVLSMERVPPRSTTASSSVLCVDTYTHKSHYSEGKTNFIILQFAYSHTFIMDSHTQLAHESHKHRSNLTINTKKWTHTQSK